MPLGFLITLAVLAPNALMIALPPRDVPAPVRQTARQTRFLGETWFVSPSVVRALEALERVGQAGCFLIPCFYRPRIWSGWAAGALAVMALSLAVYYGCWARYALRGHRFALLFCPLWKLPLPMAVAPVAYFAAAAVLLRSWYLGLAALVLAVGHLYVSYGEWRRAECRMGRG